MNSEKKNFIITHTENMDWFASRMPTFRDSFCEFTRVVHDIQNVDEDTQTGFIKFKHAENGRIPVWGYVNDNDWQIGKPW